MSYELDWNQITIKETPKNQLKFSESGHLFRKVAWDTYKPLSGSDILWQLQDVDGEQCLVALYEDEDIVVESNKDTEWLAQSDHAGENVTLSWKNIPIYRFAGKEYGFNPSESGLFARTVESQASQNKSFVEGMLERLPEQKRNSVKKLINHREA